MESSSTQHEISSVTARLKALEPIITQLCRISGAPGVSIGILHHGDIIHETGYGFRDVSKALPCDEHTTYVIGSMSKAFVATLAAALVEEGKLDWNQTLRSILPSFEREKYGAEITVTDLLSHRTGIARWDYLWLGSNNQILLDREQAISILNYAPQEVPIRSELSYNNYTYEAMTQVIEKLSGKSLNEYLKEQILDPLQMTRTICGVLPSGDTNHAIPYTVLSDKSPFEVPPPFEGQRVLLSADAGIRTNVHDLLILYAAMTKAAQPYFNPSSPAPEPESSSFPIKKILHQWRPSMPIFKPTLTETSYTAGGWVRTSLPSTLSISPIQRSNDLIVGLNQPSRLVLFHGGTLSGFNSRAILFPETQSAVVVLSNATVLANHVRWISEMLCEVLFGNPDNAERYLQVAEAQAGRSVVSHSKLMNRLDADAASYIGNGVAQRPLQAYVGKYFNKIHNFHIMIFEREGELYVAFQGEEADTFPLMAYARDSFYWKLSYDETMKLARDANMHIGYYIVRFYGNEVGQEVDDVEGGGQGVIKCLRWKHDPSMRDNGEVFVKEIVEER